MQLFMIAGAALYVEDAAARCAAESVVLSQIFWTVVLERMTRSRPSWHHEMSHQSDESVLSDPKLWGGGLSSITVEYVIVAPCSTECTF
ncbi:uncharacterized protein LAESUDRAFT_732383 [Laetiporus sulphureus 93-53]|uniref:Uncharacterized protein n=1 Tax=Laetiporus sulphureus 93-53 TaxID=1314785 RepID=A0A165B6L7_9APHY|nr:uncharacterized protein LAESUDRAFT_732383 [Laetiporus sulphureus 93-53]KZT00358.1 hypothetical protein LAESUDRAFT_732383 [Laetiporus sulphureus 93-53]